MRIHNNTDAGWWLVDTDGQIVDPTRAQFPSKGFGTYVQWDENQKEPTGSCMNCGTYCYDGDACCSTGCFRLVCNDMGVTYNA